MKIQLISLAVLALIGDSQALKNPMSVKGAQIRDDINKREGNEKNTSLFKKITAKLQDQTFIEQAAEQIHTLNDEAPSEVSHSHDLTPGDQGHRNTDRLGELDKVSED